MKDERAQAVVRAIRQYDDWFLRRVAARIARADPYGADYLELAPIIAWGVARMVSADKTRRESFVGMGNAVERLFRTILADSRKLKDVMAALELPLPMRLLLGLDAFYAPADALGRLGGLDDYRDPGLLPADDQLAAFLDTC